MNQVAVFAMLAPSACAMLSGVVVWTVNRNHVVQDASLIRQFLLVMTILLVVTWGLGQTTSVRMRIDPQFKLQTEIDANPLVSHLRETSTESHAKLQEFLVYRVARGKTLAEAFLEARPLLTHMAHAKLGWVDQKTTVAWAQLTTDTLRELQVQDPTACFQFLSMQMPDPNAPLPAFSSENSEAFQRAVIDVHASAHLGMTRQHPIAQRQVEFNDVGREYGAIHDIVAGKFGESVAQAVRKKAFHGAPADMHGRICAARIFQLEAMQARPLPMASRLLQSAMR